VLLGVQRQWAPELCKALEMLAAAQRAAGYPVRWVSALPEQEGGREPGEEVVWEREKCAVGTAAEHGRGARCASGHGLGLRAGTRSRRAVELLVRLPWFWFQGRPLSRARRLVSVGQIF